MSTTQSIPNTISTDKRQPHNFPPTEGQPFSQVITTCNVITSPSRLIILKGSVGRILDKTERGLLLDFGLMAVCVLPADSPLIEFVSGSHTKDR